jgi:hypothetical protein
MMERQVFQLVSPLVRRNAAQAIANAPDGYRCEIRPKTRTLAQNDLMWSVLTDISRQVDFVVNGVLVKVSPEEVKDILTASLRHEVRQALTEDGKVVLLGMRTSRMSVKEMTDLIDLGHALGSRKGVVWSPTSLGREG